jgi:hypothetical protein
MPYVLAGSHLEYRQFLTSHGLAPENYTYLSKPEQLHGYTGLVILVGNYPQTDLWESPELERVMQERRTMREDTYIFIFKETNR